MHGTRPSILLLDDNGHDDKCGCIAFHRMLWVATKTPMQHAAPTLYGFHERDGHGAAVRNAIAHSRRVIQSSKDTLSALSHPVNYIIFVLAPTVSRKGRALSLTTIAPRAICCATVLVTIASCLHCLSIIRDHPRSTVATTYESLYSRVP